MRAYGISGLRTAGAAACGLEGVVREEREVGFSVESLGFRVDFMSYGLKLGLGGT